MADLQLFANNAATTLAGSITNVATTANLASGAGALFPNPGAGQFFLGTFTDAATGLINEIIKVTARSGDTITMVRAQESTSAKAWTSGDLFTAMVTAGSLAQMIQGGQYPDSAFVHEGPDTSVVANTIVATMLPPVAAYAVGALYNVKLANRITGATTANLGPGAESVVRGDGSALQDGDGVVGQELTLVYDGVNLQLTNIAPGGAFTQGSAVQLVVQPTSTTNIALSALKAVLPNSANTKAQLATNVNVAIGTGASGVGGLDTGTIAASTWYYVWLIGNGAAVAGMLSLSASGPTMPAGYTYRRYCGAVRTDGSANLLATLQRGAMTQYVVGGAGVASMPQMATGVAGSLVGPSWVALPFANFIPPTAGRIRGNAYTSSGQIMVAPNNSYGAYSSTTNPPPVLSVNVAIVNIPFEFVVEGSSIYWAANPGQLYCNGWVDTLVGV